MLKQVYLRDLRDSLKLEFWNKSMLMWEKQEVGCVIISIV